MKRLILFTFVFFLSIQLEAQNPKSKVVAERLLIIYHEEAKPYIEKMAEGRLNPEVNDKKLRDISLKALIGQIESSQSIIKQEVLSRIENKNITNDIINKKIENQYKRFYPSLDFAYYEKVRKRVDSIIVKQ